MLERKRNISLILFRRVVRSLDTPSCLPRLAGENNARDDRKMNLNFPPNPTKYNTGKTSFLTKIGQSLSGK